MLLDNAGRPAFSFLYAHVAQAKSIFRLGDNGAFLAVVDVQRAENLVAAVAPPDRLFPASLPSATRMCHGFVFLCNVWKMLLDDARGRFALRAQQDPFLRMIGRSGVREAYKPLALATTPIAPVLAPFMFASVTRIGHCGVALLSFSSSRSASCSSERARSRFFSAKPGIWPSSYAAALARSLRA